MNISTNGLETISGTWVPVWTGFSADPTVSPIYTLIGKVCTVKIRPTVNGTSNATTMTMTLPFVAASTGVTHSQQVIVINNGTNTAGRMDIGAGGNIATFYTSVALGAFTGSGLKAVVTSFSYIIE